MHNEWNDLSRKVSALVLVLFLATTSLACRTVCPLSLFDAETHGFSRGAVAADHPLASAAGVEMLRLGGNAVDAAVATSFCLSVVRPASCGIGGGGFMIICFPDGRPPVALNYRETAPAALGPLYYVQSSQLEASRYGVHAAGVPGTVAGLLLALEQYGTLDRASVLAPAIRAAEEGFAADAHHLSEMQDLAAVLAERPARGRHFSEMWRVLFHEGKLQAGDIVRNPLQARALRLIAEQGTAAFYEGEIAQAIAHSVQAENGPITRADLAAYEPRITTPLRGNFRGHELLLMPPPSSGGVAMVAALGILESRLEEAPLPAQASPEFLHLLAEALKHAFADRAEWLADDAFVEVPVARLTSEAYIKTLADRFDPARVLPDRFAYGSVSPEQPAAAVDGGTSHFSIVDAAGMAVACTETLNTACGSLVEVPGFGFLLNNQMDDFTTMPGAPNAYGLRQSDRNLPAPGKRPLSSMSPTIVVQDGAVKMVAGGSGGPRIITSTIQTILNVLLFDLSVQQAVAQPRVHHQWVPEVLLLEPGLDMAPLTQALQARGHILETEESIGTVQAVVVEEGRLHPASDPRKGGSPAGY